MTTMHGEFCLIKVILSFEDIFIEKIESILGASILQFYLIESQIFPSEGSVGSEK